MRKDLTMKKVKLSHGKQMVRNILLKIEYDGSAYNGWQRLLSNPRTVQGTLEKTVTEVLKEEIAIIGSGRTDTGVHALEQTANFYTSSDISIETIRKQMNELLPQDIRIISIAEVNIDFHSRYMAKSKTYEYRIEIGERQSVFTSKYCYFSPIDLDLVSMKEAAVFLMGEHDFKGFSTDRKDGKSTVRTICEVKVNPYINKTHLRPVKEIRIQVTGSGFLYNMVRIIVGSLIEIGEGKRKPESMKEILETGNRELAGFTAYPQGLYLVNQKYPISN